MQNNKIFPFERNRFYSGKLLTSADFETEQTYFNNKRRFLSRMMFGQGIVCGFGVYNLDDLSLMIESGMAIDSLGREIIIEKSVVKKFSAIDGFEKLKSNRASLCVEYAEAPVHPVYSVSKEQANKEYEYNRISEGYHLFLMDAEAEEKLPDAEGEFVLRRRLYKDEDFAVYLRMPCKVTANMGIRLYVEVDKLSQQNKTFTIKGTIQVPAFTSESGEKSLQIAIENLELQKDQHYEKYFMLYSAGAKPMETNVIAKSALISIAVDGLTMKSGEDLLLPVEIMACPLKTVISKEIGKISLESYFLQKAGGSIKLAEIDLVRTDSAYIIEKINEIDPGTYIHTTAQSKLEEAYQSYFSPVQEQIMVEARQAAETCRESVALTSNAMETNFTTGVCEIPIGLNSKAGDVVFSDEIMHGLGRGNVYVDTGMEMIRENSGSRDSNCNIIYGAAELFRDDPEAMPALQTGIKVMTDKGTFAVAVRLLEKTNLIAIKMRWVAIRFDDAELYTAIEKFNDRSIVAIPSTVVIAPKENCCFEVKFRNMDPTSICYELSEPDSGEIKPDGIYTAPAKEGVYEIKISCADIPTVNTYAYAVVKKKGVE